MITIASTFKPFSGENTVNQVNALASWRALGPDVEIIAFGETEGLDEQADRFGIQKVSDIELSSDGLPRIDAILARVSTTASFELIVYLNGDIILFPDFLKALTSIDLPRFLMIGQRVDVDVGEYLDFSDREASKRTRATLLENGELHRVLGIDYFAFRRGSLPPLPILYAGAAGWDNLTIFLCRKHDVPVIDATLEVLVFHPNHRYRLLENGRPVAFDGRSAVENNLKRPPGVPRFATTDSSLWLENGHLRSAWRSPRHAWRYAYSYPILRGWGPAVQFPFRAFALGLRWIGTQVVLRTWDGSSPERELVRCHELKRAGKGECRDESPTSGPGIRDSV